MKILYEKWWDNGNKVFRLSIIKRLGKKTATSREYHCLKTAEEKEKAINALTYT